MDTINENGLQQYIVYHHYENRSLIDSSLALLKILEIDAVCDEHFEYYGGHWGWLVNERMFFVAQAYNIAKASTMGRDLLVCEEDAYINLVFAKKHIEENPALFSLIENELAKFKLKYSQDTNIVYIADLLAKDEILDKIIAKQKVAFDNFSTSIFHSSRQMPNKTDSLKCILQVLQLKVAYEGNYAFFQNELFNPKLAYKYSAAMLANALDSGSDFILCQSMGVFEMIDSKHKKLSKEANRDLGRIATLFLPQIILMSFGVSDDTILAIKNHQIIPEFI